MDAEQQENRTPHEELQGSLDVDRLFIDQNKGKNLKEGLRSRSSSSDSRKKHGEGQNEDEEAAKAAIRAERARSRIARKRKEAEEEEKKVDTFENSVAETKDQSEAPPISRSPSSTKTRSMDLTKSHTVSLSADSRSQYSKADDVRPPKVHLKVVQVEVEAGRPLDLVLSTNLVIRTVSKYSIAFYSVIAGDQILEINDIAPMGVPEFLSIMHAEQNTLKLSILRAWNLQPATESRMAWVKKQDNYSYFIVEVHRFKNFRNGFDVKFINKQCHVTKVESNSRGGHAFLKGDRLLDVDSIPITATTDLKFVRRTFNKVMAKENKCTFLVERVNSLRSSPNPSCYALTREAYETEMGDDAVEIGCRESMRHQLLHKKYRPIPILQSCSNPTTSTMKSVMETACEDEEGRPRRRRRAKRFQNKKISIDTRIETLRMPSDVKDESVLQKVTPKSGLISFVRNVISR